MHVGFIMDGNRRWADKKGMLKYLGHNKGADIMEETIDRCLKEGIECISIWALAKKNLERTSEELNHLYDLLRKKIVVMKKKYTKNGIKFEPVGNLDLLPLDIKEKLLDLQESTKNGNKMTFILAMAYGGQDETVRGIKEFIRQNLEEIKNNPEELLAKLDEKEFLKYIDTGKFPAPDLIIRTGGDMRLSGYFLYQSEYSEYYFTPTYWPDFNEKEFYVALNSLKGAKRNFGK